MLKLSGSLLAKSEFWIFFSQDLVFATPVSFIPICLKQDVWHSPRGLVLNHTFF